ncbi:MAG: hypothetical protein CML46_07045 [Rhodobacteraceae bacterium]|nr:hypothetical protein [Paracoccaceae bacterium]
MQRSLAGAEIRVSRPGPGGRAGGRPARIIAEEARGFHPDYGPCSDLSRGGAAAGATDEAEAEAARSGKLIDRHLRGIYSSNCGIAAPSEDWTSRRARLPSVQEGVLMSLKYRPEIDGLRTISVGAVLIYHATFTLAGRELLPSGYLGVDVFFVISGFLITSLIAREKAATGRFSIADFYERRARRLLPALFVVIFASLPFAWTLLLPSQMLDYAASLLASVFFVSNMYWYGSLTQYGADSGLVKPFLHTWSLAVEEQFYIVFPLVYVGLLGVARRAMPWLLAGLAAGGLIFADWMTIQDRNLSFYWLLSRLWELGAGAWLAHMLHVRPEFLRLPILRRTMPALGLALIVAPMFLPQIEWRHPGLTTAPTVLGAVLVIWFAGGRDPATRLLSSRIFVGVGLISYSLYLWHYPIYAFGRLHDPDPTVMHKLSWMALSFALAWFSWRVVERPFRARGVIGRRGIVAASLASAAVTCVFCGTMLLQDGRPQRLEALARIYGPAEMDNARLGRATTAPLDDLAAAHGMGPSEAGAPSAYEATRLWFDMNTPTEKVLVLGNSMGRDMWNTLALDPDLFPGAQFARFGMRANFPADQVRALLASPNFQAADTVLLAFAYTPRSVRGKGPLFDALDASGKRIILRLNPPVFKDREGRRLFDWYVREHGGLDDAEALERLAWEMIDWQETRAVDAALEAEAARRGWPVFRRLDSVCDPAAKTSDFVSEDGRKMIYDHHHHSMTAAAAYGRRIRDQGLLPFD